MRVEIRIDDLVPREMLERAQDFFTRKLSAALARGAQEMAREGRKQAPKAFSTLADSIRAQRENDLHWSIHPDVNYARPVEAGRMPMRKFPDIVSLKLWIKRKLGVSDDKKADRLSFVIGRAIVRQGIDPQPFMKPAFEAKKDRVVELANAAMRDAVAHLNGGGRAV
ncbi:MAG: hypothetical protein H3C26_00075 [Rhodocyclaceae bacterium]|nr:hypothetical protein [Rhodocyclaceae bacterium]